MANRRDFIKAAAIGLASPSLVFGSSRAEGEFPTQQMGGVPIHLEPFDYQGVRLHEGMLKSQYDALRNFFYKLPDDDLLIGFRQRAGLPAPGNSLPGYYGWNFYSTFGQWLSGMARMYKSTGDKEMLDKAVRLMDGWGKAIGSDGYFYYSRHPWAPHYLYDKLLCGLVDLYHFGNQQNARVLADRITDWAIENLNRNRPNPTAEQSGGDGTEWYTLSENLYRAYQYFGDPKYKKFGDVWRYPHYWDMFSTPGVEPTPYGFHAYSHVNTLSSAAMTYAVTGEEKYLQTIVNAYDWFTRTQFYATGGWGPDEKLQRPDGSLGRSLETTTHSFETQCCSWACFKLGKYLMQFTGKAHYGDWMERMVYNGIGASLPMVPYNRIMTKIFGNTFYYSDYSIGGAVKSYYPSAFPCCSGTIAQAAPDYHDIIYFKGPEDLYVNLYIPSEVSWNHNGQQVLVKQETNYPESEVIHLSVDPATAQIFNLKFRVPGWCSSATAEVNGAGQSISCRPGEWATLRRTWKPGDKVTIRIPSAPRMVPIDRQHPNRVAVVQGAVVLVRLHGTTITAAAASTNPSACMQSAGQPLEYTIKPQRADRFTPFYKIHDQTTAYGMYFDLHS